MSAEVLQAVTAIVGTVCALISAISVALIQRTRNDARTGREAAEAARDNTVPISNGFARQTSETLAELVRWTKTAEIRLEWVTTQIARHLAAHAADAYCTASRFAGATCRGPAPNTVPGGLALSGPEDDEALRHEH